MVRKVVLAIKSNKQLAVDNYKQLATDAYSDKAIFEIAAQG